MLDRRTALLALGALPLVGAAPVSPPSVVGRRAPRLRPGDTVGLIEPAGFTEDRFDFAQVAATIRAMGLVPKPAPHVLKRYGYLAGTDKDRAADINAMWADDSVRAVFAVRGGWGCARLLPYLDWDMIRAHPKLLVGMSDITALHLAFAAKDAGPTIHGPNASASWTALSWDSFRRLAFLGETPTWRSPAAAGDRLAPLDPIRTFRPGRASGRLLGGNLTVLAALAGTPYLPDFTGAVLFLEDTGEAEYRIDRMLTQLGLAGVLGKLAGVVFGQCTRCTGGEANYSGFTLSEVLDQHFAPLGVPAFQGALIGHVASQFSMPVGLRAEIDAGEGTIRMLEPAVA
jgi:muramoyltetrapeptide carboxypeptidase